jgi:hypothetical protein
MAEGLICWNCAASLEEILLPISRHANCPGCLTEVHCCRMCLDYDSNVADACREDRAEPPSNKEGVNFCEYFRPRLDVQSQDEQALDKGAAARAKLDSLFGSSGSSGED